MGDRLLTLDDAPKLNDSFENVIIIDGMPVVASEKIERLRSVLIKVFSTWGDVREFFLPQDKAGQTLGYGFLEYATKEQAMKAVELGTGYKLDKQHTFTVNSWGDYDTFSNIPDTFVPESLEDARPPELGTWMLQSMHGQLVARAGTRTRVLENLKISTTPLLEKEEFTNASLHWSPRGSYLTTLHTQGVALWGESDFKRLRRFSHLGVRNIDFSPCEKFLVTWSEEALKDGENIIIWDVTTGEKKRGFPNPPGATGWPVFKWSHDDKYFSRVGEDAISIYESATMGLLQKKSIKVMGVVDMTWSPTRNHIAYWVPDQKDVPARFSLMSIPDRMELTTKNFFEVKELTMHWHPEGNYVCVKSVRQKKGKQVGHYLDILRVREKMIPCEMVECADPIALFAWEPHGDRFVTLNTIIVEKADPKSYLSIFQVGSKVVEQKRVELKVNPTNLYWSPRGGFCIAAVRIPGSGSLSFVDVTEGAVISHGEHENMTDVEWDPTGRFVISYVSVWKETSDNGYRMWSTTGRRMQDEVVPKLYQMLWRPRPATLLSQDQIDSISKKMGKYRKQFQSEDEALKSKASAERLAARRKSLAEFDTFRKRHAAKAKARLEAMRKMRPRLVEDMSAHEETESVEFFQSEEIVPAQ